MTEPNLQDLLGPARNIRRGLDEETKRERHAEQGNRNSAALSKAMTALRHLHPNDYRSLYTQALEMVNAERGPLPGDDENSGAA